MIWPPPCTGSITEPPRAGAQGGGAERGGLGSPAQNPGLPSPTQARMKVTPPPPPNPSSPWSSLKTLILQPCCRFRGLHPQVWRERDK